MQISSVLTVYSGGCHRFQTWLDERRRRHLTSPHYLIYDWLSLLGKIDDKEFPIAIVYLCNIWLHVHSSVYILIDVIC